MKTSRYLLLLLCLLMLAAVPIAAQEAPLGVPLAPEQAAALPASLRSDPRAFDGFIQITEFDQLVCAANLIIANVSIFAPPTPEGYIIRTKVSNQGLTLMNERTSWVGGFDTKPWTLSYKTSGGPAVDSWPLMINQNYLFSMLLMNPQGKPMWYTEAEFTCNQSPASVQPVSGPVSVISLNPEFNSAGSPATLAANWRSSGSAKRMCKAESCMMKLTAKPAENALITQKLNFVAKPAGEPGDASGLIVMYNTKDAGFTPGTLRVKSKVNAGEGGNGFLADIPVPSVQLNGELFIGLTNQKLNESLSKLKLQFTYSAAEKSTLFVRSAYFWVVDLHVN